MNIKESYRAEVDQQHVPDDLDRRTIEAMRARRMESGAKRVRHFRLSRPIFAIVAACSCVALILGFILPGRSVGVSFPIVTFTQDPRLETNVRAGADMEEALALGQDAYGMNLSTQFDGFVLTEATSIAMGEDDIVLTARYEKDSQEIFLTVTPFSSTAYEALSMQTSYMMGNTAMHPGRSSTNGLMVAWQADLAYCVLESDSMTEIAFWQAAGSAAVSLVTVP